MEIVFSYFLDVHISRGGVGMGAYAGDLRAKSADFLSSTRSCVITRE